jgi:hypothetical protein
MYMGADLTGTPKTHKKILRMYLQIPNAAQPFR